MVAAQPSMTKPEGSWWALSLAIPLALLAALLYTAGGFCVLTIPLTLSISVSEALTPILVSALGFLVTFSIGAACEVGADWLFNRYAGRDRHLHSGRCPRCEYDLRHLPKRRCPECGWQPGDTTVASHTSLPRLLLYQLVRRR